MQLGIKKMRNSQKLCMFNYPTKNYSLLHNGGQDINLKTLCYAIKGSGHAIEAVKRSSPCKNGLV